VVRDNCYILMSIVLGIIYGFRSKFCMDDGHEMSEDSEIAFCRTPYTAASLNTGQGWWVHPSRTPPSLKLGRPNLRVILGKEDSDRVRVQCELCQPARPARKTLVPWGTGIAEVDVAVTEQ
jgi:hypothetical protein